jgi:hypothetical protein
LDNNAHSYAKLDALLEFLRKEKLEPGDAQACVAPLKSQTAANIAAQVDPYEHAWRPGKEGQPVLVNAMEAITIESEGTTLKFAVTGPEALHHVGSAKGYHGGSAALGGFRRALIPFSKIPGPFKQIIGKVLRRRLNDRLEKAA